MLYPITQDFREKEDLCDRLFRAWANRVLDSTPLGRPIPWTPALDPVVLAFASRNPFMSPNGVRILLPPGEEELPPGTWWSTKDELTGDAGPLHAMAVFLAEFGYRSEAFGAGQLNWEFATHGRRPNGRPPAIAFLGSPYANGFLARLLADEQESNPHGAWFDFDAPKQKHQARIVFHWRDGEQQEWTAPFTREAKKEIAIVRRWRTRYGNDALMFAGATAQGTAAATEFMCDADCIRDKLFPALTKSSPEELLRKHWEWTEFDAVLTIRLEYDGRYDLRQIKVEAAEARRREESRAV